MNSIRKIVIGTVGVAALAFVAGCGTSTKEVDSTTYVPAAAPAQVVVQAPPYSGRSANHYHQHLERPLEQFN